VRFLVEEAWFDRPWLRPFMKALGAIPIANTQGPRALLKALRDAGEFLDAGEVVCIFAEGEITRSGSMLPFRRGMERILKGRDVPVIPVYLGVPFRGWLVPPALRRLGGRGRTATVRFGKAMPATATALEVRQEVSELASEVASQAAARGARPLHHAVVSVLRRHPRKALLRDGGGAARSGWGALTGSVALARALRPQWTDQARVGVLLPPSVGGALVSFAASLSGRVSVPINYTTGAAALASAVRQAGLRSVVTSRRFMEKLPVELPTGPDGVEVIYLEDVAGDLSSWSKLGAWLRGMLWPMRWLERACGARRAVRAEDPAVVIFSSGSTGDPKGVVLTHANVDSNCAAVAQVLPIDGRDGVLGILPLFHSFGVMSLWFAAQRGARLVFQPNPLDGDAVGELVARHELTVLLATPTFLQLYLRRCTPGQFGSLRLVLAGAEKLSARLRDAFQHRFGVVPLEGYGTTECSPVVALSTPGFRAPGFFQGGSCPGAVGRPLPGVAVRIVDPDSSEPVADGEPGLLLVRGPNVMGGYLDRPDLDAAVLCDGWYATGDLARLDEDGYLHITDRLSRFSKIGGEMVPHGRIEEALHEALEAAIPGRSRGQQVFAVTAVPDERKGEQLAVLHTLADADVAEVVDRLEGLGLPPLFRPRPGQFVRVQALPVLGTGKLDLRACRERALEALHAPS